MITEKNYIKKEKLKNEFKYYFRNKMLRFLKDNKLYSDRILKDINSLPTDYTFYHCILNSYGFISDKLNDKLIIMIIDEYVNFIKNIIELYGFKLNENDIIYLKNRIKDYHLCNAIDQILKSFSSVSPDLMDKILADFNYNGNIS